MAESQTATPADTTPANATQATQAPAQTQNPEPKTDPVMQQLRAAQRGVEALRKGREADRNRVKELGRARRKQSVFSGLAAEFPGLGLDDIRGAALVAAEDGEVDLFGDDTKATIAKLKERLTPKSKESAAEAAPPTTNVGGTPGAAGKPPGSASGALMI